MKKLSFIIIAVIAIAAALPAKAQMRWGATVGVDVTTMKWSQNTFHGDKFKSSNSVGYTAGIIGEYEIPGIGFGIDLGLQYAQRGTSMNMGDFEVWSSDGYSKERSYLHYLDIPIHLRFKYSNLNGFERKLCPFIFAGPDLSILLAHNKIEKDGVSAFDYKPVQLGLEVGVGGEIYRNWQVTASYNWDVTGAMSASKLINFNGNNRTWKVALTYFF